jgi:predicted DCC family thiol-disulfide oxidoreductase YuxK
MPSEEVHDTATDKAIVFYDGVCGLCSHTVSFLLKRDRHRRLHYAPLQGTTAEHSIPEDIREKLDTLVYAQDGRVHYRSAAVARILMHIGGIWKVLGFALWLVPLPIRDSGYRIVSRMRYRLFGKHEVCRLPTLEERNRFLD